MKWFKHDCKANRDMKLEKVLMKYGADGYALYWLCIELIADNVDSNKLTFELEHDAEILGHRLKIDTIKVNEIMTYMINLGLFENYDGTITCLKLAERIENSIIKSVEFNKLKQSIKQIRDNPGKSEITQENSGQNRIDKNRIDKNIFTESNESVKEKVDISDIVDLIKDNNLTYLHSPITLTKHHYIQIHRLIKTYSKDIVLAKLKTYYSVSFAVWFTKQGKTLGSFLKNFDEIPVEAGQKPVTDDELIHNHPDRITGWSMKDEDQLCRTPKEREQYRRGLLIEMRR